MVSTGCGKSIATSAERGIERDREKEVERSTSVSERDQEPLFIDKEKAMINYI